MGKKFSSPLFCYMDRQKLEAQVEEIVRPVIKSIGYNIVDVEYVNEGGWILRLFVERPDGTVTIDDCSKISRSVEGVLDVEDLVKGRYLLEVSSPGINRPLKKLADFERFKGELARIKTNEPIDGRGNYFGKLVGVADLDVLINVDGTEYKVPLDKIAKARLEVKVLKEERKSKRR